MRAEITVVIPTITKRSDMLAEAVNSVGVQTWPASAIVTASR